MRKSILLVCAAMLLLLSLTGCSLLRGAERSFAVVLCIDHVDGEWHTCVRIPTYQSSGEYASLEATGSTFAAAMTALDHIAPMQLHFGQTRAIIFGEELARSSEMAHVLNSLFQLRDLQRDAILMVTPDDIVTLNQALNPASGTRLSKSLDELIATRLQQGVIPMITLNDVLRFSDRQALFAAKACLPDASTSNNDMLQLSGCYAFNANHRSVLLLDSAECQQLLLMLGQWKRGVYATDDLILRVAEASSKVKLLPPVISVNVAMQMADPLASPEKEARQIQSLLNKLCAKLASAHVDALGIGRQAARFFASQEDWTNADWPSIYEQLSWQINVDINVPMQVK